MKKTQAPQAAPVSRPHWTANYLGVPADVYLDLRREMAATLERPERDFLIRHHGRTVYIHLSLATLIRVLRKRSRLAGTSLPPISHL